ncbi:MAG: flagellar basal body-associated FliL family protein [Desulfovibrio sp.]|nr:flagellar basal body-associated FliL family protein [Desulfovibrio sp.]
MAETKVKQAAPLDVEVGGSGAQLKKVELDLDDAPFLEEEKPAAPPVPRGDDATAAPDEADAGAGKGKRKKKLLILAAAGGVILLVAAAAVWWFMFRTPPPPPPEPPKPDVVVVPSAPAAQSTPDIVKEFAPFVVPSHQPEDGTRFLVCKFSAIIKDPAVGREMDQRMLSLRDAIYYYLRSKDNAFLMDAHNGPQIKSDLLGVLNDYMAQGKIEDILFESYLNQ